MEEKNNTKKYVTISLIIMTLGSLWVAWIMGQNYKKDTVKERFRLTQLYKDVKKAPFEYDEKRAQRVYQNSCFKCHGNQGEGSFKAPSLVDSKIVQSENMSVYMEAVLLGKVDKSVSDHGKKFSTRMPRFRAIPYKDLAYVMTLIKRYSKPDAEVKFVDVVKFKIDQLNKEDAASRNK